MLNEAHGSGCSKSVVVGGAARLQGCSSKAIAMPAVVGPFPRGQAVRDATPVAGHFGEAAGRLELDGRAEGIADGKAEKGSTLAIR